MPLESPASFATAIRKIESDLGVRYPASAPQLLSALSAIVGTPAQHGLFEHACLLVTSAEVAAVQNEVGGRLIDGYLLPFLKVEGRWPEIYGYNLAGPLPNRIGVYRVHTIVYDWPSEDAFLKWIKTFSRS